MTTSNARGAVLVIASIFTAGFAFGDVTTEQFIKVEAGGVMSMLSMEGTVTTSIADNKSRIDNDMKAKSGLINRFAKNLKGSTIILPDDELMLQLILAKKQYSELTFEQIRNQLDQAKQVAGGTGESQASLPISEDECQWSEPVLEENHSGEKQRFGGVKAEQHIITASQTCTVPDSGQSCDMTWNLEYWNAKRMPGRKEIEAYQDNLAQKMGGEEMLATAKVAYRGLLNMFKQGWEDILSESEQMKGYPVKTVMSLEIGGESCTTGAGQPIALDNMWGNAADAGLNAATNSAAGYAGHQVADETAGALGNSVGGSIAGSAVGAASRKLVSGVFKSFRKKKDKKKAETKAAPENTASGSAILFKITSELRAVNEANVAPDRFVAPAGWKKVKAAGI